MSKASTAARQRLVLLGTLAALALPVVLAGMYVAERHAGAQSALEQLEPRHARLLGVLAQQGEIERAREQAQALRARWLYPASQDATQTGNQAQQRMRELLTAAGLQVRSSQVLPAKEDHGLDRIGLTLTVEGNLLALQSALAVLAAQTPVVVLSDLDIRVSTGLGNHQPTESPRLTVQMGLSVLRERS